MCAVCCKGTMNGVSRILLKCMYGTISSESCYMLYIILLYSAFSWWHSDFAGANHDPFFSFFVSLPLGTRCTEHQFCFCQHCLCPRLVFCSRIEFCVLVYSTRFMNNVSHVVNVRFIHCLFALLPFCL